MLTKHCGDHFTRYINANITSLHHTPETVRLYVNCILIFFKKRDSNISVWGKEECNITQNITVRMQ